MPKVSHQQWIRILISSSTKGFIPITQNVLDLDMSVSIQLILIRKGKIFIDIYFAQHIP